MFDKLKINQDQLETFGRPIAVRLQRLRQLDFVTQLNVTTWALASGFAVFWAESNQFEALMGFSVMLLVSRLALTLFKAEHNRITCTLTIAIMFKKLDASRAFAVDWH